MRRHIQTSWLRSVVLAGIVLGVGAAPAGGQEFVEVTDVTFDRVAHLCGESTASGCVILTGTITCDETGLAELVSITLTQRGVRGTDNLDLLDFACTTEPRPFAAIAETFDCSFGGDRSSCFRPGPALAVASISGEVVAEARVIVRKA